MQSRSSCPWLLPWENSVYGLWLLVDVYWTERVMYVAIGIMLAQVIDVRVACLGRRSHQRRTALGAATLIHHMLDTCVSRYPCIYEAICGLSIIT